MDKREGGRYLLPLNKQESEINEQRIRIRIRQRELYRLTTHTVLHNNTHTPHNISCHHTIVHMYYC